MKFGIGTYSFGGIASYLGLGQTLREKFETAKNLGFERVELLPVDLSHSADDLRKWLSETGLEAVTVHAKPDEGIVKAMAAIGGKAVIWAGTPFCNKAEAIEVAKELDDMADMAAPHGIKVGYHNHSQEFFFCEGKSLLEHLLDNSEKCYAQLDCGWAMNGGMYPPYFIRKYLNRIIAIHVKENDKVKGPGGAPESRHSDQPRMRASTFSNVMEKTLEERQKMLDDFNEMLKADAFRMDNQCKMGSPGSNIDWVEIKKALDEQDFEAYWIVEREGFYDEHDKCLQEDSAWLKANIR